MVTEVIDFQQPPRLSGDQTRDQKAVVNWLWSFFNAAVTARGFVQTGSLTAEMQTQFPTLYALGVLSGTGANLLPYFTGGSEWALTAFTDDARLLLSRDSVADMVTFLGVSTLTTEQVQDIIATLIQNGSNIAWTYNDGANTLTADVTIATAGTWTPAFTGLTEVLGGGTVVKAGRWQRVGNRCDFEVEVSTTGGATSAAVAGTTYCDMPFGATRNGACIGANITGALGIGTGAIIASNDRIYVPAWAATSNTILISGTFEP